MQPTKPKLKRSNCLIQAIIVRIKNRNSTFGFDFNSPSRLPSFYVDTEKGRHRFRRKIFRKGNKNLILFRGYNTIEPHEPKLQNRKN